MIKTRIKYLITLCILLSSVGGQLVLNKFDLSVLHHQVKNQKSSQNVHADIQQSNFPSIYSSTLGSQEKLIFDYDEKFEEDDKEDVVSSKKIVENLYSLSTIFSNRYTKFFFLKNSQALHFSKHFSRIPSNKLFIVFRVFRI